MLKSVLLAKHVLNPIINRVQSRTLIHRLMSSSRLEIELSEGVLSGVQEKLPNGENFYAFRGVPYAKPPIGNLRFKPPVPLEAYSEPVLDCSKERDVCFHRDTFSSDIEGSEDCLFLNVYTPKLKSETPLPVMIFLHGGAYATGSGNSEYYSPEHLIMEDVIVVTINYRLHVLGFLCLPKAGITGNYGLKDQHMAIKWVAKNISKFNGDPNNITLFGESAGAACVHMHLLSPLSRPYIHRVICQSGLSPMEWAIQENPEDKARWIAKLAGCEAQTDEEIGDFLREVPVINIMMYILSVMTEEEKRRMLPIIFKPVIEQPGPDAILTRKPMDVLKERNSLGEIPILTGVNDREGLIMLINAKKRVKLFEKDVTRLIPWSVNLQPGTPECKKLGDDIRNFYFGGKTINEDTYAELADALTDFHFEIFQNITMETHAKYQHKSPQYYYQFAYSGKLNMYKKLFQFENLSGACHADELTYLFIMKMAEVEVARESKEWKIRRDMCRLWTNFAKYGNPTPDSDATLPEKWKPVENVEPGSINFNINCLYIGDEMKMIQNPNKNRIDFWRNVYKIWNQGFLKPKL